ncbi:hypothetical protein CPB83DRAFT_841214 [Crepidotus variabilis]|uniref:Uncharacterized protein n=1 Tax=Crepidotus variabilis TaxID=179855 RepID=A0A9P6E2V8_9AGAR|nr:hypothetical protein CPB83DRAFT_841214 [Crepidotus variabilis]
MGVELEVNGDVNYGGRKPVVGSVTTYSMVNMIVPYLPILARPSIKGRMWPSSSFQVRQAPGGWNRGLGSREYIVHAHENASVQPPWTEMRMAKERSEYDQFINVNDLQALESDGKGQSSEVLTWVYGIVKEI